MAGQPCPKAWDTLAGWRPFLKGSFPFEAVVFRV